MMNENNRKNGKTALGVLVIVCIITAVAFLFFLLPAFVETTTPNNAYVIRITGLNGLTANGTATVMVPIPANADGVPAIPEETLTGNRGSWWQTSVRETPYGKMLAFTTTNDYLLDIDMPFGAFETKEEPRLLMPVLQTSGNASVTELSRLSNATYTTVVYLGDIVPPSGNGTVISFSLEYQGGGGMEHLVKEDTWTTTVHAAVPSTESGFVPVPAEYLVIAGGIRI